MQEMKAVLFLLATTLVYAQKSVTYRIEYTNGTCSGTNPDPLTLTVSDLSTALDIMEQAVREGGESYEFLATFSDGDGAVGYDVDSINGRAEDPPCYWSFYVQSGTTEIMPTVGVSHYVPGNNFVIIMRYEALIAAPAITTHYIIDYPDPFCFDGTPLDAMVDTRPGNSALDVMEEAVAQGGRAFNFSVSYGAVGDMEESFGYVIQQLNGVATNGNCSWIASVTNLDGIETVLTVPVSQYILPGTGYTLTLRFVEPEEPVATTQGSATKSVFNFAVLLISCAIAWALGLKTSYYF